MIKHFKTHGKYIIGIGAEKLFIIGGILMTIRGITGTMLGHKLSPRERFCYICCGVSDHLSFIIPIALHSQIIFDLFKQFEWSGIFFKQFGGQIIYVSIRYSIFTGLSWLFYIMSKPSQIKKVWNHYFKKNSI